MSEIPNDELSLILTNLFQPPVALYLLVVPGGTYNVAFLYMSKNLLIFNS